MANKKVKEFRKVYIRRIQRNKAQRYYGFKSLRKINKWQTIKF